MCSKLVFFVTDVAVPSTAVTLDDLFYSGALALTGGLLFAIKKRRLEHSLALWAGISMIFLAAPHVGAQTGTGNAGSANKVQSIPAPSQEKSSGPAADSADYVGAETTRLRASTNASVAGQPEQSRAEARPPGQRRPSGFLLARIGRATTA
jgi:hypothetical protein